MPMTRRLRCTPRWPLSSLSGRRLSSPRKSASNWVPYRLDNGLKVLALEDHAVPAMQLLHFSGSGSRDERPAGPWISHCSRHMMFNGTKKYGQGVFDRMLESKGGRSNAYTMEDLTVYYEDSPRRPWTWSWTSRRTGWRVSRSPRRALAHEREVVKEERRLSTDNDIEGAMLELLQGTAYLAHPYPVAGGRLDARPRRHRLEGLRRLFPRPLRAEQCHHRPGG